MIQTIDPYKVNSQSFFEDIHRRVLAALYLPIIGKDAFTLYQCLWGELDRERLYSVESTHYRLFLLTGLKMEAIDLARIQLEAVGLLRTFKTKEHHYYYELCVPISPKSFFKHPILSVLLYRHLGALEYEKTVFLFKQRSKLNEQYQEITKSFNEVYELNVHSDTGIEALQINQALLDQQTAKLKINYDETLFYLLLENYQLSHEIINDELKELLAQYSWMYHLEAKSLAEMVALSIKKNKIDLELFKKHAIQYYNRKVNPKELSAVYHQQPLQLQSRHIEGDLTPIKRMDLLSPYEYYRQLIGHAPSQRELMMLEAVLQNQKIPPGVLNVIIDYIVKKEGFIKKNYLEAIASTMATKQITTVEAAMIEIKKSEQSRQKQKGKQIAKKVDYQVETISEEQLVAADDLLAFFKEDVNEGH